MVTAFRTGVWNPNLVSGHVHNVLWISVITLLDPAISEIRLGQK